MKVTRTLLLALAVPVAVGACGFWQFDGYDSAGAHGDDASLAAGDGAAGTDGTGGGDSSPTTCGFSLTLSASSVPLLASESVSLTVTVDRLAGFTGEVDVSVSAQAYVTSVAGPIVASSTSTTISLTAATAIPCTSLGDVSLNVSGATKDGSCAEMVPLGVHLHGVCETFASPGETAFVVPNVPFLRAKAWGAGGGASTWSGGGGGGGFVTADFPVTPGETLTVEVGAGGTTEGTGGGASAVKRGSAALVIAGGGGGGGASTASCGAHGSAGGGGGGVEGGTGDTCGNGATQTANGAACADPDDIECGGGGGRGIKSGGMGGCQLFSSGMTGTCMYFRVAGGGGGGSGGSEALDAGVVLDANIAATSSAPANATDPDWLADAGIGAIGSAASVGSPGRVVLIVP